MARSAALKSSSPKRKQAVKGNGHIRTYRSALNFLNTTTDYERMKRVGYNRTNFNLSRMTRLLAALGNPHKLLKFMHIGGTKGKGSTAMMLAEMLGNCGYKVGLYTSPHLIDIRERIQVNGRRVSESEFTKLFARIAPAARKRSVGSPTFFELMTAAAFVFFADQGVDLAVIETGLGGRLDSTNVIKPEVCGMTSISLDHVEQLGNSLEKIAEEKAGIFKSGIPVISAPQLPAASETLRRMADHAGAPLRFTGEDIHFSYRFESSRAFGPHARICVTTPISRFEHLRVPLWGVHQAVNCSVALGMLDSLKERGFEIDDQKAMEGLANVRLPGRMEIVCDEPRVLVDGAHNAASVEALMRAIGQNIPYDSMVVIFGCQQDKDVMGMLHHIKLGADKAIFTQTGSPRSCDPQELASMYVEHTGKMAQTADSLAEALEIAERAVGTDDLICITGSFYLVGLAKRHFNKIGT